MEPKAKKWEHQLGYFVSQQEQKKNGTIWNGRISSKLVLIHEYFSRIKLPVHNIIIDKRLQAPSQAKANAIIAVYACGQIWACKVSFFYL